MLTRIPDQAAQLRVLAARMRAAAQDTVQRHYQEKFQHAADDLERQAERVERRARGLH